MALADYQHALSRLVMSPPFRAQVAESPEEALAGFDLSPRELERVAAVARDPGMRTGTLIHRSFRLSMLSNTLPRTCKALGPQGIKDFVHAYWLEQPPRSLLYVREGMRFGDWALARMRADGFRHDLLPEVLEAEMATLELSRQEAWDEEPAATAVPRLHPHLRIVRFRRDPDVVLPELAAGRIPEGLEEGEHYLLVRTPRVGEVTLSQLTPEAGRVLLACRDGALPGENEEDQEMVRELVEEGYLLLAPPGDETTSNSSTEAVEVSR
jgi:hypothetical protein